MYEYLRNWIMGIVDSLGLLCRQEECKTRQDKQINIQGYAYMEGLGTWDEYQQYQYQEIEAMREVE